MRPAGHDKVDARGSRACGPGVAVHANGIPRFTVGRRPPGHAEETLDTEAPSPDKRPIGFVQFATPSFAQARYLLLHEVKRFFKPELFNRLDVVVFRSLEPMGVLAIADLFDDQLVRRLAAMRKVEVLVDEAVLDKLAADGFDPF